MRGIIYGVQVPTDLLRIKPEVHETPTQFKQHCDKLRDSIATEGIKVPLTVEYTKDGRFVTVDGDHRGTIAIELGLESVPCNVTTSDCICRIVEICNRQRVGLSFSPPREKMSRTIIS